jgi:hypothetical protein
VCLLVQMALDIDLEGFGFLESDSDATSKLSPTLSKQPPISISPIESESSSGISSLDSDDLKVSEFVVIFSVPLSLSLFIHTNKRTTCKEKKNPKEKEEKYFDRRRILLRLNNFYFCVDMEFIEEKRDKLNYHDNFSYNLFSSRLLFMYCVFGNVQ